MEPARAPIIVLMISQVERNMAGGTGKEAYSADPYPRQAGVLAGAEQGGGSQPHVMQGITHQAFCQCRRIALCAQVSQHHVFQGVMGNPPQQVARLLIGQMPVRGGDALFQRPGPLGSGRQHVRIIV